MFIYYIFILMIIQRCHGDFYDPVKGPACQSEDKPGVCIKAHNCPESATKEFQYKSLPDCSTADQPGMVCCTMCLHVHNISNLVVTPTYGPMWKIGIKAWDKCLDYVMSLPYPCKLHSTSGFRRGEWNDNSKCHDISYYAMLPVGGRNAKRSEYPHMALLGYGEDLERVEWLCGGSIISDRFILTAAHCKSTKALGSITYAALGILKRTDPEELWQRYKVERIILHPEYKAPSKYHDIALVKTVDTIEFERNVLPACLFVSDADYLQTKKAVATGWGALGHRKSLADNLQTVELQEFTTEDCAELYPTHRHMMYGFNETTQMCYGDHGEVKDTCQGDSGGPLQLDRGGVQCQHIIIGVTSSGFSCGFLGTAGLYTRVDYYRPWIESVVWP